MTETPIITAFLDASVLYPALTRDILMRLGSRGVFDLRWSAKVHDEWAAALARDRPDIPVARIERTRRLMLTHLPAALVEGYEQNIESLTLPDADDRHVLAAALHCEAQIIVTANLRDFPDVFLSPRGVEAQRPDAFILGLFNASPEGVRDALRELRASLKNPPMTAANLLSAMARQELRETVQALTPFADEF